jgi:hypothetical protein
MTLQGRLSGPHAYWLDMTQAAEIRGLTPTHVRQLVQRGFLAAVRHSNRSYHFGRAQVEVMGDGR